MLHEKIPGDEQFLKYSNQTICHQQIFHGKNQRDGNGDEKK